MTVKIKDIRHRTPRTNGTRSLRSIRNIARHHSATTDGNFDTFWKHWRYGKGWGTGGYHEIILRDGTVELCYDPDEITNGIANHNSTTYHICVVGNGSFTAEQERVFEIRARYWMARFGLPVSAVRGHREFKGTSTSCPGINMETVRARLSGGPVHVAKPVAPKPSGSNENSLVDYLNKKGRDSSFAARKKLAEQYGIKGYEGTAAQNTTLLDKLKSGAKPMVSSGGSLVDYLNSKGQDSSFGARKRLAGEYGISNYTGTAAQNLQLLDKLRSGKKQTQSKKINTNSLVDYLKLTKQPSDFTSRKKLAKKHGIRNYKGTANQNKKLLDILNK